MYQKITQRRNILSEILMVREALLPYQETLRSLQNYNPACDQLCNLSKSKPFYVMLKNKIRNIEDCRTKNFLYLTAATLMQFMYIPGKLCPKKK